jgi:uncharacterized protein (TIGR02145 family)
MVRFFSVLLFFFQFSVLHSQVVSNILVSQEQNNILVSYDLLVSTSCSISLQVSQDGGASWSSSLKSVKGDVGEKIVSGSHTITWFVLEEYNELRGDNIKFKVSASSGFPVIKIGSQVWTSKNLDVATYRNGDVIPQVQDQNAWANLRTGAWCYYDNDASNGTKYGKLYNWYAVNDPRGLAPKGFHIPSDAEWTTLTDYLGGVTAGTKMKSSTGWDSNGNGTNSSGFAGFPGGYRNFNGSFGGIGRGGNWWSATGSSSNVAWYRYLNDDDGIVYRSGSDKQNAFSVRCLGD